MKKTVLSLAAVATLFFASVPNNAYAFEKKESRNELMQSLNKSDIVRETEPNNDFLTAEGITAETAYSGTLSSNDVDYYKIDVTEKGYLFTYGFVHESTSWVQATLYDSDGHVISKDNGSSLEEMFFSGTVVLEPGTYYVKLTPKPGIPYEQEYFFFSYVDTGSSYRLPGADRYQTSVTIASNEWALLDVEEVILTTGEDFPDALAAGPLAYQLNAPILLTRKDDIPTHVFNYLKAINVSKVTIIGGEGAVSAKVEKSLRSDLGIDVERIAGEDRFDTAAQISERLDNTNGNQTAYIVNGRNFPDALSISPIAARQGAPILLVESNGVPTATADKLANYPDTYVIGGKSAVSDQVYSSLNNPTRISGSDRYETSVKISEYFYDPSMIGHLDNHKAYIATGFNFADALSGAVGASRYGAPLLLTPSHYLHPSVKSFLTDYDYLWFTVLGGNSAINDSVMDDLSTID